MIVSDTEKGLNHQLLFSGPWSSWDQYFIYPRHRVKLGNLFWHFFTCYPMPPFWIEYKLKSYCYGFESSLRGYFDKCSVHWRGKPGM